MFCRSDPDIAERMIMDRVNEEKQLSLLSLPALAVDGINHGALVRFQ